MAWRPKSPRFIRSGSFIIILPNRKSWIWVRFWKWPLIEPVLFIEQSVKVILQYFKGDWVFIEKISFQCKKILLFRNKRFMLDKMACTCITRKPTIIFLVFFSFMCYFSLPNKWPGLCWSGLLKQHCPNHLFYWTSIRAEDLAEYYFILNFKKRDNSYFHSFKKKLTILILYVFFSKDTEPHMFP